MRKSIFLLHGKGVELASKRHGEARSLCFEHTGDPVSAKTSHDGVGHAGVDVLRNGAGCLCLTTRELWVAVKQLSQLNKPLSVR